MTQADLENLYRNHFSEIYRYVFRFADGADGAMDLVQDVFYRALEHAARQESKIHNPRAWLYSIARNHCISTGQRQVLERRLLSEGQHLNGATYSAFEPRLLDILELEQIWEFLAKEFSDKESEIFQLYVRDGLNQEEIAAVVALSQSAVSRILIAVTSRLREHFRTDKKVGKILALLVI